MYSHFYGPSFSPDFVSIFSISCKRRSIKMIFKNWLQTTYCLPELIIKIEHPLILDCIVHLFTVCLLIFNISAKQRKQKYYIEYKKKYKEKPIVKFRKSFVSYHNGVKILMRNNVWTLIYTLFFFFLIYFVIRRAQQFLLVKIKKKTLF